MKVQQPVKLSFNPCESTKPEEGDEGKIALADLWLNKKAAIFWMCWRPHHIVNQHFLAEVMHLTRIIEKHPPGTWEELRNLVIDTLRTNSGGWRERGTNDEYYEDIFDYLILDKPFKFIIVDKTLPQVPE